MTSRWRTRVTAALGGLAGGIVTAFSLPPFGFWPLAFLGVAVLYVLLRLLCGTARLRLLAGFSFGIGFFGISYLWITDLVFGGWVVLVIFESVVTALACVAACVATNRTARAPNHMASASTIGTVSAVPGNRRARTGWGLLFPLLLTAALVLADAFRWWWPFGGMPIGSVALGQAAEPLAQLARLGGPLLVEAAAYLVGAVLGEIVLRYIVIRRNSASTDAERGPSRNKWKGAGSTFSPLLLIVAMAAVLAVATYAAPDGGRQTGTLRVAAVQGGGQRGLHALFTDATAVYEKQLQPTLHIPTAPHVNLVLWPEDVISLDGPLAGSPEQSQVATAARRLHATLVAGVTETVGATQFRNEAVAWAPDGAVIGSYEKVHRVPFGEYIPFRSFFAHLGPTSLVPRDAIAGRGPGILHTPAGSLGVMISFEVFFPDRACAAVKAGATVLLVPTNDASYSTGQVPAQEVAADRLRAIEEGRDLVQAAPTGYTDFVDNRGNVLRRSSLSAPAVEEGTVALHTGRTWYSGTGDGPVIALCALALLSGWAAALRRRQAGGQAKQQAKQQAKTGSFHP